MKSFGRSVTSAIKVPQKLKSHLIQRLFGRLRYIHTNSGTEISVRALSRIKGRFLAGQAAAKQTEHKFKATPQDVKVTKLSSGVTVASLENYSPVSRISVVYGAGSRHEPSNALGITHCLRVAANQSSKKATAFSIAKHIQQIGGSLSCSTGHEQVTYSISCLRNNLATGIEHLNNVATGQDFRPWEVEDAAKTQRQDIEVYLNSPETQLIEAVHKAAYRDTLGQSLYMPSDRVGTFSIRDMEAFVKTHYVAHNAIIAGVGIDHDVLAHLARKFTFASGHPPEHTKAKYHGGELRLDHRIPLVRAAVVTEGVALDGADVLPLGLLEFILGTDPYVKYSGNIASSRIAKAAAAATSHPFAASAISVSYSDTGLFGFQVMTNARDAGKVLKAIVTTMGQATKNSITDADVQRAKRQLKAQMYMEAEGAEERLKWIGAEALLTGQVVGLKQLESEVDKITLEEVNRVAKKILNGKPTMAAVGDLSSTPYLDELI